MHQQRGKLQNQRPRADKSPGTACQEKVHSDAHVLQQRVRSTHRRGRSPAYDSRGEEERVKGRKRNEEEEKLRETVKEGRTNILVKGNVKEDVKGKLEEIENFIKYKIYLIK